MVELVRVFPSLEQTFLLCLQVQVATVPPAGAILVTLPGHAASSNNRKPLSNGAVGGHHRDLRVLGVILVPVSGRHPCGFPIPAL